ncbi:MAG TPA: thioredoxin domain-containing protein [Puia sp.]|nr:thioredoxin domain-containing protein [Puia sp.]
MKKWLLGLSLALSLLTLHAQTTAAVQPAAPYLRFPTVPPFKILKVDSSGYYTKDDLKKNRRTLVMFFSPTCEHCKHQTEDILAAQDQFKDVEIVMATYQPFGEMKDFYTYYRIGDHPNIKLGRDEKYTLPGFYSNITSLPYIALYDKKGNLITTFQGNQKVTTLMTAFHSKD